MVIILGLFLVGSWFYWFQYRPSKIRSYCAWAVRWEEGGPQCRTEKCYDFRYKECLHSKGLK